MRTVVCLPPTLCLRLQKNPFAGVLWAALPPGLGGWLPRTSVGRVRPAGGQWPGWPVAHWLQGQAAEGRPGTPPRWGEAWRSVWRSRGARRAAMRRGAAPPGSGWCCGGPGCSCEPHSWVQHLAVAGVPVAAAAWGRAVRLSVRRTGKFGRPGDSVQAGCRQQWCRNRAKGWQLAGVSVCWARGSAGFHGTGCQRCKQEGTASWRVMRRWQRCWSSAQASAASSLGRWSAPSPCHAWQSASRSHSPGCWKPLYWGPSGTSGEGWSSSSLHRQAEDLASLTHFTFQLFCWGSYEHCLHPDMVPPLYTRTASFSSAIMFRDTWTFRAPSLAVHFHYCNYSEYVTMVIYQTKGSKRPSGSARITFFFLQSCPNFH